jgi:hypothetical protein
MIAKIERKALERLTKMENRLTISEFGSRFVGFPSCSVGYCRFGRDGKLRWEQGRKTRSEPI